MSPDAPPADPGLRLPRGSRVIHIGPPKTGSTALQHALHASRDALTDHGVVYAGDDVRPRRAGWALMGAAPRGRTMPPPSAWTDLVDEVGAAGDSTVLVSNEDFGRANDHQAGRIVRELGQGRPHVLMVARRYDRLLPSYWQELVKGGEQMAYHEWLRVVLQPTGGPRHRRIWLPQSTPSVVERWAGHAGLDNVTVIVADEARNRMAPDAFEQLLGLPTGLLDLSAEHSNRSLTLPEAELVRRINHVFADGGWSGELYHQVVQNGVVLRMRRAAPAPTDARVPGIPAWAVERIAELNRQRVEGLQALGVRVIGDLDLLDRVEVDEGTDPEPSTISLDAAAQAVEGAIRMALRRERKTARQHAKALRRAARGRGVESRPFTVRVRGRLARLRDR
ncbi:hypothetical protein [Nocardioides sp. Root151]|uniref:hypothetical protein n=1 Tax=Nocardioides sp. Root151 TaxID=1736475 RepID=UPI000A63AC32|nr:hypothetical protein [Nocardioides sp. Root151]